MLPDVNVLLYVWRTDSAEHAARRLAEIQAFTSLLLNQPHCQVVQPGPRHWDIFERLCRGTKAAGNLVQDAWFAALAIESGCEWMTADRDYARFDGLRWCSPI